MHEHAELLLRSGATRPNDWKEDNQSVSCLQQAHSDCPPILDVLTTPTIVMTFSRDGGRKLQRREGPTQHSVLTGTSLSYTRCPPTFVMEDHDLDTKLLVCFLKKHFHDEKLSEVSSVEVKKAVPEGENYASLVFRVKINCLTTTGRKKSLSIIVKTELRAPGAKKALEAFPVFRVETRIYTTILPMMEDLMEEFGDKRDKLWADLLGFKPYNLIAFSDLSGENYIGAQRRNCLDFNHAKLVLRNVARFHAMSKLLLARNLITADDRGKFSLAVDDPIIEKWWDVMLPALTEAMVNSWGDEWTGIAERLMKAKDVISLKVRELSGEYDKRFEVLNHGDLWTCNLLFKYMEHEDNFPVSVKFVDYQMSHVNSFIWDVVYFLITSTVPSVRRARLNDLLAAYQQALEKNLQLFNYSEYIPTLDDVKSEWERTGFSHLCFYLFNSFMTAETTQAFDMEKLFTSTHQEIVHKTVFTDGKVLNGLGDDFKNLALAGFI